MRYPSTKYVVFLWLSCGCGAEPCQISQQESPRVCGSRPPVPSCVARFQRSWACVSSFYDVMPLYRLFSFSVSRFLGSSVWFCLVLPGFAWFCLVLPGSCGEDGADLLLICLARPTAALDEQGEVEVWV